MFKFAAIVVPRARAYIRLRTEAIPFRIPRNVLEFIVNILV